MIEEGNQGTERLNNLSKVNTAGVESRWTWSRARTDHCCARRPTVAETYSLVGGSLWPWSLMASDWLVTSRLCQMRQEVRRGSFVSLLCFCRTRAFLRIAGRPWVPIPRQDVGACGRVWKPLGSPSFSLLPPRLKEHQYRDCLLILGSAVLPILIHAFLSWGPTSLPLLFCSHQKWPRTAVRSRPSGHRTRSQHV